MTSKERTRRYRQRQEEGLRVIRVEISEDVVRALIAQEYLDPQRDGDQVRVTREAIGKAISELLEDWEEECPVSG